MTPGVRFLSNLQKAHLHSMPFFDDDPNLSFQGFREDMKNQPQVGTGIEVVATKQLRCRV